MKINIVKLVLAAGFVAILAGCGGSNDAEPAANNAAPATDPRNAASAPTAP